MNKNGALIPYMIIGSFASFILFIGYIMYRTLTLNIDLVSKDYYQQEKYTDENIAIAQRSETLKEKLAIRYETAGEQLVFDFKDSTLFSGVDYSIQFYRPSEADLDFATTAHLAADKTYFAFSTQALRAGYWRGSISFEKEGKKYRKAFDFTK